MKKLKKSQIFTIVTCGLAAVLLTMVLAAGLCADSFGFGPRGEPARRGVESSQALDPQEEDIDSLEVKWLDGPVTVGLSPDGLIHITERSAKQLDEAHQMDVSVKSGRLAVRWDGQWFRRWFNVNLGWLGGRLDKELEVLLPAGLAGDLEELLVENTSDALRIADCHAQKTEVSTVSGSVTLQNCTGEEGLNLSTVSGEVVLEGGSGGEAVRISTVSGGVEARAVTCREELNISTVSGGCRYQGTARVLHLDTVSGEMEAVLGSCPDQAALDSVSGGLRLELPEGAGFVASYSSISGAFDTDFPVERSGDGKARCGNGGGTIHMSTTSGNMGIYRG